MSQVGNESNRGNGRKLVITICSDLQKKIQHAPEKFSFFQLQHLQSSKIFEFMPHYCGPNETVFKTNS